MKKILFLLFTTLLFLSCKQRNNVGQATTNRPVITVTLEPLRYFTEAIAGDRFRVVSMVPKGSSPETYDPTPQQLVDLSRSTAYFRIGYIGFEQAWIEKLADNVPHLPFLDMSEGIELIYDSHPTHTHATHTPESDTEEGQIQAAAHSHTYGVEPHVWNSTTNARILAINILDALCSIDKEGEAFYQARYDSLCHRIAQTDSLIRHALATPGTDRSFLIYHPALSYFARDYGLHQIPIEAGGKEPSPAHLKELIDTCRNEQVHVIFVQPEFDRRNAELIARQTGSKVVDINPLAYDWEAEMLHTAYILAGKEMQTNTHP